MTASGLRIQSNVDSVIAELSSAFQANKLIVFAGAGVSEAAGLPSRAELLRRLQALATDAPTNAPASPAPVSAPSVSPRSVLSDPGEAGSVERESWPDTLAELRDTLGTNELSHWIETYLDDTGREIPPVAQAIAAMSPRLRAVLTVNMDFLLERAFGGTWTSFARVTSDIPQRQRYILKLHGVLSDRSTWALTRDDHDRKLHDPRRRDVLNALYRAYTILFVLHDFSDHDIESIVEQVHAVGDGQLPRHFALVPTGQLAGPRKRALERSGIRVLEMDGCDPVTDFLASVASGSRAAAHRPRRTGETRAAHPLRAVPQCPFPGLDSFDTRRAHLFFGREAEVSTALQPLGDPRAGHKRWLFIDGASGVGKSSFALAGLVPKVQHGHIPVRSLNTWHTAVMRPGANPVWNLAHTLHRALSSHALGARPGASPGVESLLVDLHESENALVRCLQRVPADHGFFLVIDQLEEIFTLATDDQRRTFDALIACALEDHQCPLYLASTMRADFASHMAGLPRLESLLNSEASRYYLRAMSAPGLRTAMIEPARRAGLEWDEHLVDQISSDAADSDGSLPLVAHVLQALWFERDGNRLTYAAYKRLGGVSGALTRSADAILYSLPGRDRDRARELLSCLAAVGPRGDYVRRPISRDKAVEAAGGGDAAEFILARLSGARDPALSGESAAISPRLIVVHQRDDGDQVELVHEALLWQWKTLSRLLDDSRKQLLLHDDLKARLDSWRRAGSCRRALPGGAELEYLRGARHLSDPERAFLAMAGHRERSRRRGVWVLMGFLVLCVLGVSWLALYAFVQRDEATRMATSARFETMRALEAESDVKAHKLELQEKNGDLERSLEEARSARESAISESARAEREREIAERERRRAELASSRESHARHKAELAKTLAEKESARAKEATEAARRAEADKAALLLEERARVERLLKRVGMPGTELR